MDTTERHLLILIVTFLGFGLLWLLALALTRALRRALAAPVVRRSGALAWARTHPLRAWLEGRMPRLYRWLSRRLDPRSFSGLPLTLMVAAGLYIGFLVAGLVEDVLEAEELVRFDRDFNDLFGPWREGVLLSFFTWVTELGSSSALLGIAVVSTGFLWAHGRGYLILPLWVTYAGAHATTWAGKFVFARERPEFVTGVSALSPSFPSAHATGSMAVYGFVAYAIARDLATFRGHFEITYWSLVLIALVGFSRVFLSVHYLSDVVTGFLVGVFWLLVGFAIAEQCRPAGLVPGRHRP